VGSSHPPCLRKRDVRTPCIDVDEKEFTILLCVFLEKKCATKLRKCEKTIFVGPNRGLKK